MLKLTGFIGKGAVPLAVSAENGKTGAESLKLKKPSKEGFLSGARVAQLVEQRTENPRVGGSIPSPSTT